MTDIQKLYMPQKERKAFCGIYFFGGVFMCRYNQLWGCVLIALGFGILLGTWLEGGFLCHCLGIGGWILGLIVMKK